MTPRPWEKLGLLFGPDGSLIATASRDGTARIWSLDGAEVARLVEPPARHVMGWFGALAFSPDGARLAAGSDAGAVHVLDRTSRQGIARLEPGGWVILRVGQVTIWPAGRVQAGLTRGAFRLRPEDMTVLSRFRIRGSAGPPGPRSS